MIIQKKNRNIWRNVILPKKGKIIIQGDLNAHTNTGSDTIRPDKFDNIPIPNLGNIPERNSEDKLPSDHRGKELLELCKASDLVILNGRKTGDIFGKLTSFQWNGSSVADYVVVSQSIYDNIEYFKVREYIPWLSDHSAVSYKLSTTTGRYVPGGINDFGEVYESIFWDKNSRGKFLDGLKKCENEINELLNTPNTEAKTIPYLFKNMIHKVIKDGNFKKRDNRMGTIHYGLTKNVRKRRKKSDVRGNLSKKIRVT